MFALVQPAEVTVKKARRRLRLARDVLPRSGLVLALDRTVRAAAMPPRSRSSTVTSTTSSHREHLATNPHELVDGAPTSSTHAAAAHPPAFSPFAHPFDGPKSYASEHSLRTIRPHDGRGSPERSPDDHDHADEDEGDDERAAAGGAGRAWQGRRAGPQFVIDLDAGSPTEEDELALGARGRPRSSTFGGVELPPSAQGLLESDYTATTSTTTGDTAGAGVSRTPRPDYSRQRSTSLSSLTSLRSLDPALHLGGAPLRERRPMLYAGLQAGGLLVVSVLGLWLVLKGLLPPIDPEHQDKVKLPKSFDDLKSLNEVLQVRASPLGSEASPAHRVLTSAPPPAPLLARRSTASATTGASWAPTSWSTSCAFLASSRPSCAVHLLTHSPSPPPSSPSRAATACRPSPFRGPCTSRSSAALSGASSSRYRSSASCVHVPLELAALEQELTYLSPLPSTTLLGLASTSLSLSLSLSLAVRRDWRPPVLPHERRSRAGRPAQLGGVARARRGVDRPRRQAREQPRQLLDRPAVRCQLSLSPPRGGRVFVTLASCAAARLGRS